MATLPLYTHPITPPNPRQNWGCTPSSAYFTQMHGRPLHALEILWQFAAPKSPIVYDATKRLACCPSWGVRSAQRAIQILIQTGFATRPCERSKDLALLRPAPKDTLQTKRLCGDWVRVPARSAVDHRPSSSDRILLGFLRSYANKEGESYWFNSDIAEMIGLSVRQIRRSKRTLVSLGYIALTHRANSSDVVQVQPVADLNIRRLIDAALQVANAAKVNEKAKLLTEQRAASGQDGPEENVRILDFAFNFKNDESSSEVPLCVRSGTALCPPTYRSVSGQVPLCVPPHTALCPPHLYRSKLPLLTRPFNHPPLLSPVQPCEVEPDSHAYTPAYAHAHTREALDQNGKIEHEGFTEADRSMTHRGDEHDSSQPNSNAKAGLDGKGGGSGKSSSPFSLTAEERDKARRAFAGVQLVFKHRLAGLGTEEVDTKTAIASLLVAGWDVATILTKAQAYVLDVHKPLHPATWLQLLLAGREPQPTPKPIPRQVERNEEQWEDAQVLASEVWAEWIKHGEVEGDDYAALVDAMYRHLRKEVDLDILECSEKALAYRKTTMTKGLKRRANVQVWCRRVMPKWDLEGAPQAKAWRNRGEERRRITQKLVNRPNAASYTFDMSDEKCALRKAATTVYSHNDGKMEEVKPLPRPPASAPVHIPMQVLPPVTMAGSAKQKKPTTTTMSEETANIYALLGVDFSEGDE